MAGECRDVSSAQSPFGLYRHPCGMTAALRDLAGVRSFGSRLTQRPGSPLMLLQLSVFLLSLSLFTAWGLPISAALRGRMPALVLSTPAFGAGVLAVLTTLLYVAGL